MSNDQPYQLHNQAKNEIITIFEKYILNENIKLDDFLVLLETTICAGICLIKKDCQEQLEIFSVLSQGIPIRLLEIKK
jgi:hypothetical protein